MQIFHDLDKFMDYISTEPIIENKNTLKIKFTIKNSDLFAFKNFVASLDSYKRGMVIVEPTGLGSSSYNIRYPDKSSREFLVNLLALSKLINGESTVYRITINYSIAINSLIEKNDTLTKRNVRLFYGTKFNVFFDLSALNSKELNIDNKLPLLFFHSDNSYTYNNSFITITSDYNYLVNSSFDIISPNILDNIEYHKSYTNPILLQNNYHFPCMFHFNNLGDDTTSIESMILSNLLSKSIILSLSCKHEFIYNKTVKSPIIEKIICTFQTFKHEQIIISNENYNISTTANNNKHYEILCALSFENLYSIYNFILEGDYSSKLNIVKNVIGLHLTEDKSTNFKRLIDQSKSLLDAIKSNYQIFSEEKIQYWFDERRKTNDNINDYTTLLLEQISGVAGIPLKILYSFFAIVIGGFIPYTTSNNFQFLKILLVAFILLLPIVIIITIIHINSKYTQLIDDFNHFKVTESTLLHESEIETIVGSRIDSRSKMFNTNRTITICLSITIEIALIIAVLYFNSITNFILPT